MGSYTNKDFEQEMRKERLVAGILADGTDNETLHLFSIHYIKAIAHEKSLNNKHVIIYQSSLGKDFVYPFEFDDIGDALQEQISLLSIMNLTTMVSIPEWLDKFPQYLKIAITRWPDAIRTS